MILPLCCGQQPGCLTLNPGQQPAVAAEPLGRMMQHAGQLLQPAGSLDAERIGIMLLSEGMQRVILLPGIRRAEGDERLLKREAAAG
ncbi:hypothetical protein D3C80_1797880 [compost metagenome]